MGSAWLSYRVWSPNLYRRAFLWEPLQGFKTKRWRCREWLKGKTFNTDYAISLGGDGTFLRAASKVGAKKIPIIGVNMGTAWAFLPTCCRARLKRLWTIYTMAISTLTNVGYQDWIGKRSDRNLSLRPERYIHIKARQRFDDYNTRQYRTANTW